MSKLTSCRNGAACGPCAMHSPSLLSGAGVTHSTDVVQRHIAKPQPVLCFLIIGAFALAGVTMPVWIGLVL